MKKTLKRVFKILLVTVGILLLICVLLCFALYLPFEYIKYKRSVYYKNEGKKYRPFVTFSVNYKVYNETVKHSLPVKYLPPVEGDDVACGRFVYNKTLIIPNCFTFNYDNDKGIWVYEDGEHREIITLDEYVSSELEAENVKGVEIEDAVVLIDTEEIVGASIEEAEKEKRFLISHGNVGETLKSFCAKKGKGIFL